MTLALSKQRTITAVCGLLLMFTAAAAQTDPGRGAERARQDKAQKAAAAANPDPAKDFYAATEAVPKALKAGKFDQAETLATELLTEAEKWTDNWNYGNAVHIGNLVLGHVALKRGKMDEAKAFLLKAGKTPGSPQLNSFGPNMLLAKELLAKGERQTVLAYFDHVKAFWAKPELDQWKSSVEKGEVPEFGANLKYGF